MKKKSKNILIKVVFYDSLMVFAFIYFSEITGYYEYSNNKKTTLTEEQIKKFEKDIKSGNKIDVNDYIDANKYEYNNSLSKLASKLSDGISKVVNSGVRYTFKYISKFVND